MIILYFHEFNSPLVGRIRITETLGFVLFPRSARRHLMDHFLYRRCLSYERVAGPAHFDGPFDTLHSPASGGVGLSLRNCVQVDEHAAEPKDVYSSGFAVSP